MRKMTKQTKIAIGIGAVMVLAIAGFGLYKQIMKLLNYTIKMKNIVFNEVTATKLSFDAYMSFKNNSDLKIVLSSQEYEIYINKKFITTVKSNIEQTIYPNSTSDLQVKVDVNPRELLEKLGKTPIAFIASIKEQDLMIVSKFKVKYGILNIPIEYPYEDKLKNWV